MTALLERIGLEWPIFQAPMAGTSTPAMVAAVSNAGGLGGIGLAAEMVEGAGKMIRATQALTNRPFNVNVFCHRPAIANAPVEARWIARLKPEFTALGAEPPSALREIYQTFRGNAAMTALLLETRPAIVSFHFGLPNEDQIRALKQAGILLFGTATDLVEAQKLADGGIDAIVAQGYEAGGHRGLFDYAAPDDRLGTFALTRLLVRNLNLPVIAAGGIMDGAGIAAALRLGAVAAQMGTAFVGCPESSADQGYRAALASDAANHTTMVRAISGRPARCLANRFTKFAESVPDAEIPDYPIAYDLGKALHAAGKAKGEYGFGAQWAGQGAPLSRPMPAAELVRTLVAELQQA
ncbi:MAG TPA: nitronate monooxygenase [Rhizomicrobium sp.]|jgi:nitronate monooxygenase|nr:nitronate monooxygenase [Rhizomicrobium sp.]